MHALGVTVTILLQPWEPVKSNLSAGTATRAPTRYVATRHNSRHFALTASRCTGYNVAVSRRCFLLGALSHGYVPLTESDPHVIATRVIRMRGSQRLEGDMTSIAERLVSDLGTAMRQKDVERRDVLRYLRSEVKNAEIEKGRELTDDEVLGVIQRQIKQRRESIEQFQKGNRQDLVDTEAAQIVILETYLPPQMDQAEIEQIAASLAEELDLAGARDMGKLMGPLRERVGTQAEGRAISEVARNVLEQRANGEATS